MMNPGGPVEEAGETARGLIDALKAQPATLALIVSNVAMLLFIFYALHKAADFRDRMLSQQSEFAVHVTDLLSRCIVPDNRTEIPLPPLRPVFNDPAKELPQ